jgi:hypothetical protein
MGLSCDDMRVIATLNGHGGTARIMRNAAVCLIGFSDE